MPRKSILIVDDSPSVRQALGQALCLEDFDVLMAANCQQALREFLRHRIDLALLDLNLGCEESGWELFQALTSVAPWLPIVVMSGYPDQFRHELASQAAALFEKPIDFELLFGRLRE